MPQSRFVRTLVIIVLGLMAIKFFFMPWGSKDIYKEPFMVRVRVKHKAATLKLSSEDRCVIKDIKTGEILEKSLSLRDKREISPYSGGIKFGGVMLSKEGIRVSPLGDNGMEFDGTLYRGEMDIISTGNGLDVINRVELEDYLKGVLPREVHHFWPFSALKAQAIVSRSYAVYMVLHHGSKNYDLTADTFSQVYGGISAERWRTTKAVRATKGKVLEYDGKILPAYFHSCCGGHTEDASRLWGKGSPPLRGVKCSWCRWSPYFRWQVRVPTRTILEKLNARGYQIKRVDDIRSGTRDKSGRLEYVRIKSRNRWIEMKIEEFRGAIGRKTLRSANFSAKKYPTFYLFSGYGWGHGVGMCQWGAFGLALRWKNEGWILKHYYPGAKVVELREVLK